jgi:CheY-like chemotaxis protein
MTGAHVDASPPAAPDPRPLVFVVDDSSEMRALLSDVLATDGCRVVVSASAERALRLMASNRPDAVITDLFMPGMSGFALRSAMLRRPDLADVPVIVLSAFWRRPGETLDAFAALPKPLNVDRLLDAVRRAVRSAEAELDG